MTRDELRRQIFRRPEQWAHGIGFRLSPLDPGGLALVSCPGFAEWITRADGARCVGHLAVDACGRIFWIHRHDGSLWRFDPASRLVEAVVALADGSDRTGSLFGRLVTAPGRLWILDRAGERLIALRTDTLQIIAEEPLSGPIDVASASNRLFVLDRDGVRTFDETGRPLGPPRRDRLVRPVAIAADPRGQFFYVVDAVARGVLRFRADGSFDQEIARFDEITPGFTPRLLAVGPDGNLFVSDRGPVVYEFSIEGGYIGGTGDTGPLTAISGLTFSGAGDLLVSSPPGIARFTRATGVAGQEGVFYSGTLDNGATDAGQWHRLDLVADIEASGVLDVFYATDDKPDSVEAVAKIFADEAPISEKVSALERLFDGRWQGPQELRALGSAERADRAAHAGADLERPASHSVLFAGDTKRYLWLKLVLSGHAPRAAAAVRELRIYYPRLSYLRYLPAVYQQDKPSREFLQRYLALFETVFTGLEGTIERIPELFDPQRTPPGFLDWLAQWLDLGVEEDWPAAVKQRLIQNASRLYGEKGTPAGLSELIGIVVDRTPVIRESFETERPYVLGGSGGPGLATRVFAPALEELPATARTRLGLDSILGTSSIRADSTKRVNPFRAAAGHFSVVLDLSPREFERHARGLHRIIQDFSPAHVDYDIRLSTGASLGSDTVVGMNCRVDDPQPLHLGHSMLGRGICVRPLRYGPELGIDAVVAGSHDGPRSACAHTYGER